MEEHTQRDTREEARSALSGPVSRVAPCTHFPARAHASQAYLTGMIGTHLQQHLHTSQSVSGLGTQHPWTDSGWKHSSIEGQDGRVEGGEACGRDTVRDPRLGILPVQSARLPHQPWLRPGSPSKSLASRST